MREEKKYEVLPGVEIPDMKRIQEAASDFSVSDVGDVEIKTVTLQPVVKAVSAGVSDEDLSQLQNLGNKVAEDEARAKAESRAKMDKIMHNVKAPESMTVSFAYGPKADMVKVIGLICPPPRSFLLVFPHIVSALHSLSVRSAFQRKRQTVPSAFSFPLLKAP